MNLQWSCIVSGFLAFALLCGVSGCGGPHGRSVDPCRVPATDRGVILENRPTALTGASQTTDLAFNRPTDVQVPRPGPSPSPSASPNDFAGYADLSYTDPDTGAPANYTVRLQTDGEHHYWAHADEIPEKALRSRDAVMELTLYKDNSEQPTIVSLSLQLAEGQ